MAKLLFVQSDLDSQVDVCSVTVAVFGGKVHGNKQQLAIQVVVSRQSLKPYQIESGCLGHRKDLVVNRAPGVSMTLLTWGHYPKIAGSCPFSIGQN